MADLESASAIAASGLRVQAARMRIISENMANADSTSTTPGGDPYRRRSLAFKAELDKEMGGRGVEVYGVRGDQTPFRVKFDPANPGAGADGFVKLPNVDPLIELVDMREAQRAYEANLNMIESARTMKSRTLDLLRR
ncbi:MAG: flagellar basal body rod protein FlgC [Caulobacterales bacterium]